MGTPSPTPSPVTGIEPTGSATPLASGAVLPSDGAGPSAASSPAYSARTRPGPSTAGRASCAASPEKTGTHATASVAADATEASLTGPAYLSRAAAARSAIAGRAGYRYRWLPL